MARPYELRSSRHVVSRVCLFMSLLVGSTSFLVAPRTGHGALTPRTSASGRGVEGRPTRQDTFPVFALRRASLLRTRHLEMSADAMPGPDVLGMDDIIFERYVGSVSYTESVTIEGDGPTLTAEGALRAGTDLVATVGTATVRVFAGSLDNIGMVTRGEDVRITLKEFPPPSEDDGVDLAANEVRALQALAPQGSTTLPFPWLYGELKMDFAAGDSLEGDEQWTAQIGTAPPRKGSRWLVYAYDGDGGNTLLSFSRPTAVRIAAAVEQRGGRRSMALAPLPRDVPWIQTARFVVKGIVPQALEALARMHEAGYAHRVLSSACIQLSAKQGMNKNVALENCDPSMLTIKLNDLARATPLSDTSAPRGAPGLIAEDLSILGFILLQLFLTALAETKTIDPKTGLAAPIASPPALSIADLRRQLALFDGRLAGPTGFSEFCRGEPAWNKVVALLDDDDNLGWRFLHDLISAPVALAATASSPSSVAATGLRTARGMASHPFLRERDVERAIVAASRGGVAGSEGAESKGKLFGLFDW